MRLHSQLKTPACDSSLGVRSGFWILDFDIWILKKTKLGDRDSHARPRPARARPARLAGHACASSPAHQKRRPSSGREHMRASQRPALRASAAHNGALTTRLSRMILAAWHIPHAARPQAPRTWRRMSEGLQRAQARAARDAIARLDALPHSARPVLSSLFLP